MQDCGKSCAGCGLKMDRRGFLRLAGASALAAELGALDFASSLAVAQSQPAAKNVIHAVFVRPKQTPVVSWPGGQADVNAMQALFAKTLQEAAEKLGLQLEARAEPLENTQAVNAYLEQIKKTPPDGLIVCAMELTHWGDVDRLVQNRGDVPTVLYSNVSGFTGNLQATRNVPKTFVGATQDVGWLAFALRMLNTIWRMRNTRLLLLRGGPREFTLKGVGTTIHEVPRARFNEEFAKVQETDEVRAMADAYLKDAKEVVEPAKADVIGAAKNYVVLRRILAAENCQGVSVDCLGWKNPVCIAFSRLLDEGVVAGCEADVEAAVSQLLTFLLFDRPGFIQDPSPNTVNNTLIGAHCTSATRLEGAGKPYRAPFRLRNYHTRTGASMQVLWPVGEEATVMKFQGSEAIILGSAKVVSNISQPPSGGCRTSVELKMNDMTDTRDCKGFHQIFILGNLEREFKAYCQLAGIKVVHI